MNVQNNSIPYVFRESLAAGTSKTFDVELTGVGYIRKLVVNFAAGENGTLHIRPYIILNGSIVIDLIRYGASDKYISGDDEQLVLDCNQAIENHAHLCIFAENTGAGASQVNVNAIVEYMDIIKIDSVIGSPGRRVDIYGQ